jgi:hypothetical protein
MPLGKAGAVIKNQHAPNGYIAKVVSNCAYLVFQFKQGVFEFIAFLIQNLGPFGYAAGAVYVP